ncbi:hypothetical protein GCM10007422_18220 [Pedobacter zeae]|nr:hypothetical protein GCM10007422_18220 [Pedobacter zeae]
MPVVLGNPDASTVITMVSNPNCNPCARAHSFLETWIAGRDDIQVKVVFATADHDNDIRTKVARHLAALTLSNEKKIAERALTHWYEQKGNFEAWAEAFPLDKAIPTNDSSERQKQWCKMAEITFTPTILINGYKMPDPYQLEDLRYLLN